MLYNDELNEETEDEIYLKASQQYEDQEEKELLELTEDGIYLQASQQYEDLVAEELTDGERELLGLTEDEIDDEICLKASQQYEDQRNSLMQVFQLMHVILHQCASEYQLLRKIFSRKLRVQYQL